MTIHVLVEGPSERAFFEPWIARLLNGGDVRIHPHQGKGRLPDTDEGPDPKRRGLLDQLPAKLRAFRSSLGAQDGVLVVVDADEDDQDALLAEIRGLAQTVSGLRASVSLAVEEVEAFYLGDLAAIARVFPDADMQMARGYEPDSICGTWELFGRIVGDGGGNKVWWAQEMGPAVTTNPARSRSPSFKKLVAALRELAVPPPTKPKRVGRYRHPPRVRRKESGRR
ncbi:MAG: DUF4276 family protein [Sandaracinaceae bacterium]|nr:DUF4276 family protein [Sandaracinaceae bacterium]